MEGPCSGPAGRSANSTACQDAYSVHSLIMYSRLYCVFGAIIGSSSGSDPYISEVAFASSLCRSRSTGGRRLRLWRPHPGLSQNRGIEGILREDDEGGRVAAVVARVRRSISARCAEV
jgi:hypothetical protein